MTIQDLRPAEDAAPLRQYLSKTGTVPLLNAGTWRHRLNDGTFPGSAIVGCRWKCWT